MSIPGLFFGQAESNNVLACGEGYEDAGLPYVARVRSNPASPGDTEERMWPAVYLMLSHRVEANPGDPDAEYVEITVRAVVDNATVVEKAFTLLLEPLEDPDNPPARVRRTYEVALSSPRLRGLVQVGRNVPAGTIFQLEVEWHGSDVAVDDAMVECEPTGEVRVPV